MLCRKYLSSAGEHFALDILSQSAPSNQEEFPFDFLINNLPSLVFPLLDDVKKAQS